MDAMGGSIHKESGEGGGGAGSASQTTRTDMDKGTGGNNKLPTCGCHGYIRRGGAGGSGGGTGEQDVQRGEPVVVLEVGFYPVLRESPQHASQPSPVHENARVPTVWACASEFVPPCRLPGQFLVKAQRALASPWAAAALHRHLEHQALVRPTGVVVHDLANDVQSCVHSEGLLHDTTQPKSRHDLHS